MSLNVPTPTPPEESKDGESKRELPEAWQRFLTAIQKEAASLPTSKN
ncbi:hypothetical protein [Brevibacillus panacihumi]|nr:hypothetical protein [Brevibacillus panacihumi]